MHGEATPFPGHPKNPYSDADLAEKLRENMRPFAGAAVTERLVAFLQSLDGGSAVRLLAELLVYESDAVINEAAAE